MLWYCSVVIHRNHISIMSSDTLDLSDGVGSWDFTDSLAAAFTLGPAPLKDLGDGSFAMYACDMDGQVTATDFNLWLPNTKAAATSQVPDP